MTTIVFCHAHPDDEASQTSGAMARAAAEGHRVVVVFATNGDHGEVAADAEEGETVAAYRRREAEASAAAIGLARIAWLGYADSGMAGWEQNDREDSLHGADLDEAAGRLAAVLDEEDADVARRLRLARWLRAPRPRQGPPRRTPCGRARRAADRGSSSRR